MANNDIFSKKPKDFTPKNTSKNDYLGKKNNSSVKDLKEKVLQPESDLKSGQNIRVHKETHALLKVISLEENREMYSIINKSLHMYLDSMTPAEQKNVWKKMEQMIDLKLLKF